MFGNTTNPSMSWAAGGVISTAPELARYVKAMVGGGLLSQEMQQRRLASLQPAEPKLLPAYRYGYTWDTFGPTMRQLPSPIATLIPLWPLWTRQLSQHVGPVPVQGLTWNMRVFLSPYQSSPKDQ